MERAHPDCLGNIAFKILTAKKLYQKSFTSKLENRNFRKHRYRIVAVLIKKNWSLVFECLRVGNSLLFTEEL